MVLKIYGQIFYYGIGYAVGNKKTFRPCVIETVLKLLGRHNTREITDEDLDNGTAIFQASWMCKRNALLYFEHYVDIVVNVVILCISRFRDHVAAAPRGSSRGRALAICIALTRGLQLIQYIAMAENLEGKDNYDYEKDRLKSLDIVKDIVRMVELVVAGFEFRLFHVKIGLNIINALCKSGHRVMKSNELRALADFLGCEIVNNYDTNVKELLHEITTHRSTISTDMPKQQ